MTIPFNKPKSSNHLKSDCISTHMSKIVKLRRWYGMLELCIIYHIHSAHSSWMAMVLEKDGELVHVLKLYRTQVRVYMLKSLKDSSLQDHLQNQKPTFYKREKQEHKFKIKDVR